MAGGVVGITVHGAEVEGGDPVIPLFKPFLLRASGEELSAGRYVHLVMARLLFWSGAAVRLRSKGSLEREAPPGVSWDSSWLLGSSFLSLFRTCSYSKPSREGDG